jgi:hypothetical protein
MAKKWLLDAFEEYVADANYAVCPAARDMDEISMAMADMISGGVE